MRTEILEKINQFAKGTTLSLANLQIEDNELTEIMEKIKLAQPNLSLIVLDGNNLSDKGAQILRKYLSDFPQLSELSVQFNNIDTEGALAIFSLCRELKDLRILFRGNKIRDEGKMHDIKNMALK